MNYIRLSKNILGIASVLMLLGIIINTPVSAQAANANAAQGIQISPALVELNAARGKTYNITLNITNVTSSDLVYSSSVEDFDSADETGSPRIILDGKLPETISAKSWVATIPRFTLISRQSRIVNAQIVITNDAEPGGHYAVLRFSGSAPQLSSTGVGLSASAGVLILIRVDGAITEKASLASFYGSRDNKQTSFFENGPITFVTRIKNEGNIHIKPVGSIEVRDVFGGLVSTLPVNKDKSNVLPRGVRRFEADFDKTWMLGSYTANLTIGYGSTGQAITSTISFWVIPYKIILVGLFVVVTLFYILKRLIKVYNKYIIEKAKNEIKKTTKKHYRK